MAETLRNPDSETAEGIKAVSGDYAPSIADHILLCTTGSAGHQTITLPLPTAAIQGMKLLIKKVDSGNKTVIIDASSNGSTLDGANSATITDRYAGIEIVATLQAGWVAVSDTRATKSASGVTGTFDAAGDDVLTFVNGVATSVA